MIEKETEQTKELPDIIVAKFRKLFALESRLLEAREQAKQTAADTDTAEPAELQETLKTLETQLAAQIEEMEEIIDALRCATPSLRTYVLPQMLQIVEALKTNASTEQTELTQLATALTKAGNTPALKRLRAIIITHLRANLEKTFGT